MTYHKKIISNNIEKNIYLIYLFSLPFGRFIDFHLPTILQTYFLNRFCCFFFFFGFIIMTIKKVSIGYNPNCVFITIEQPKLIRNIRV